MNEGKDRFRRKQSLADPLHAEPPENQRELEDEKSKALMMTSCLILLPHIPSKADHLQGVHMALEKFFSVQMGMISQVGPG